MATQALRQGQPRPIPPDHWVGPRWDHTLCTIMNDLRAQERHASRNKRRKTPVTWENALPLLPGGQVVAGSNPVSPTQVRAYFDLW